MMRIEVVRDITTSTSPRFKCMQLVLWLRHVGIKVIQITASHILLPNLFSRISINRIKPTYHVKLNPIISLRKTAPDGSHLHKNIYGNEKQVNIHSTSINACLRGYFFGFSFSLPLKQ
jgi:hypothetical protein